MVTIPALALFYWIPSASSYFTITLYLLDGYKDNVSLAGMISYRTIQTSELGKFKV